MHSDGTETKLSPAEFSSYGHRDGDDYDFRDFGKLISPKRRRMMKVFRKMVVDSGGKGVYILTARDNNAQQAIRSYLKRVVGELMTNVRVITLGSSDPFAKAIYLREKIAKNNYNDVYFCDDHWSNVKAVGDVLENLPQVTKFKLQKV